MLFGNASFKKFYFQKTFFILSLWSLQISMEASLSQSIFSPEPVSTSTLAVLFSPKVNSSSQTTFNFGPESTDVNISTNPETAF